MSAIVIRFINEPGIVSKLLTWQTNSLCCHCEALSRDGKSSWIGAHAGSGVEARPIDWCKPTWERQYKIELADDDYERAMTYLEGMIGQPYNYKDIIGLGLHRRMGVSDHAIICSALMLVFMMRAGLQPLNCREGFGYLITPETLHLSPLFIGKCVYHYYTGGDID